MRPIRLAITLAALPLALACASRSGTQASAPRYDRNLITSEEIAEARAQNVNNVFDLVRSRRPMWLRTNVQGVTGRMSQVAVWVDRVRMGGVESLAGISTAVAVRIRFLSPSEAQGELGLDNTGGAIVIETGEGRR